MFAHNFKMFKKNKKLILCLVLIFSGILFFSHTANAQPYVWDYANAIEGFLDIGDSIYEIIIKLTLAIILSTIYVLLTAALLQWAIGLPVYLNSPVVLAGWTFIQGVVNLFLVLSLIFIAIAYILKLENFPVKKLLPKLLIVMLLVNFSMLLVGIITDVSQFFMNTFLQAFGTSFIDLALIPLKESLVSVILGMSSLVVLYMGLVATVYGVIPLLIAIVISAVTGVLSGSLFQTVLFVVFNFVLGSIFGLYFILFLTRIIALWLLAIFSPLAFFCLIFPQTKKWWDKWLHALVQWAFVGVVALFLLGLISSMFNQVFQDRPSAITIGGLGVVSGFFITDSLYNYLFMAIFLGVAWHITKNYMPAGASAGLAMLTPYIPKIQNHIKSIGKKIGKTQTVEKIGHRMATSSLTQQKTYKEMKHEGLAREKSGGRAWTRKEAVASGLKSAFGNTLGQPLKRLGHGIESGSRVTRSEIANKKLQELQVGGESNQRAGMQSTNPETRRLSLLAAAKTGNMKTFTEENGISDRQISEAFERSYKDSPETFKELAEAFPDRAQALRKKEEKEFEKDVESKTYKYMTKDPKTGMEKSNNYRENSRKELNRKQKMAGLDYDEEDAKKYNTRKTRINKETGEVEYLKDAKGNDLWEERLDLKLASELKPQDAANLDKNTRDKIFFPKIKDAQGNTVKDKNGKEIPDEEAIRVIEQNRNPNQPLAMAREGKTDFISKWQGQLDIAIKYMNPQTISALHRGAGAATMGMNTTDEQVAIWEGMYKKLHGEDPKLKLLPKEIAREFADDPKFQGKLKEIIKNTFITGFPGSDGSSTEPQKTTLTSSKAVYIPGTGSGKGSVKKNKRPPRIWTPGEKNN